jgi:hypothetical protein
MSASTLNIHVPVVNPYFIELQYLTFNKFLGIPFSFTVFNDVKPYQDKYTENSAELFLETIRICSRLNISCVNVSNSNQIGMTPSERHSSALGQMLSYQREVGGKYLYVDSDLLLVKPVTQLYDDYDIAYVPQERKGIDYPWPGIFYVNLDRAKSVNSMNWSNGNINGVPLDTGGMMHNFIEENRSRSYLIQHIISGKWNSYDGGAILNFLKSDPRNENGMFFAELYDGKFLHYRAGMNWIGFPQNVQDTAINNLKKMVTEILKS